MPPMSRASLVFVLTLLLAGLACSAPLIAPPTPTPTATATSTPTVTPSPTATATPTPTPSAGDLIESGHHALFNGDWDQALGDFDRALQESQDPLVTGEARYGRGLTMLWSGDTDEAYQVFWRFISDFSAGGHPQLAHSRLLRGDLGIARDARIAVEDYQTYLTLSPGLIDSYAEEWLGDALMANGQPGQALQHYSNAVADDRAGSKLAVMVKIGRAMLQTQQYEQAIAQFDLVASLTQDPGTKASMNLLAGQAYEQLGDLDSLYARLLGSVANYPTANDTYVGLVRLVNEGVPVDDFQRGLVDFYAAAYEPAVAAFDRLIANAPTAAAYYYRGLSQRGLGNSQFALDDLNFVVANYLGDPIWEQAVLEAARTEWAYLDRYSAAVDTYLQLADTLPDSPSAPDAMLSAGRTAERVNDLGRAAEIWQDLAVRYPASQLAAEGAFQAGIALYRLGDFSAAQTAFQSVSSLPSGIRQQSAALLWVGKALAAQGQPDQAAEAWNQSAQTDPTGYYSERAKQLLAGEQPFQRSGSFDFTTDPQAEQQQAEDWLRATFGIQTTGSLAELSSELAADPRLIRGDELWQIGRWDLARQEFDALRAALANSPEAMYRLMHHLVDLGLYREAIFASRQILNMAGMDDAQTLQAPVLFNRVRFGPYFSDLILPEAADYGFDGLFLLSVVRQESLFEGFAISSASARGLMQVIPSTGESIAAQLGWPPDYQQADLYRPLVSVRFGTYYLANQRDRFDGDLYAALAAYNAGPGNSIIWKDLAPDDPDLFLEVIRLDQPQLYIQVISEVYQIYQLLYASG